MDEATYIFLGHRNRTETCKLQPTLDQLTITIAEVVDLDHVRGATRW